MSLVYFIESETSKKRRIWNSQAKMYYVKNIIYVLRLLNTRYRTSSDQQRWLTTFHAAYVYGSWRNTSFIKRKEEYSPA